MKLRLLILAILLVGAGQSANLPFQWVLHSPGNLVAEYGPGGGGGLDWAPFGGTVTNYVLDGTNYTLHMFTNTGQYAFLNFGETIQCDILVVGGGGAGGNLEYYDGQNSGGGGGGGVSYQHNRAVTQGIHTVFIGPGAIGSESSNGGESYFADIISLGGGQGGGYQGSGTDGGSGGGSTSSGEGGLTIQTNTGGAVGFGSNGGVATSNSNGNASGGGGAGTAGESGMYNYGGEGGDGLAFDITGIATYYGGGGGGGSSEGGGSGGWGGQGGGGTGEGIEEWAAAGSPGTPNTGGGGGGRGRNDYETYFGYAGGSGVVILRYPPRPRPLLTTGGTITTTDMWVVHTFNVVGEHAFNVLGDGAITCEVFAVGGGGAGSVIAYGSGGGGGGVVYGCVTQTEGKVAINVGSGGASGYQGEYYWEPPTSGGDSSFGTNLFGTNFIALGGGYGGCDVVGGGCGGGGGYDFSGWLTYPGGAGSQGGNGGSAMLYTTNVGETIYDYWGGGGGGGAMPENGGDGLAPGGMNPPTPWCSGAPGFYTNFDGAATNYGGGGGGRFEIYEISYENAIQTTDYYADGGVGGGGGSGGTPTAGTDGLGGGGSPSCSGGSGIVIVRYKVPGT